MVYMVLWRYMQPIKPGTPGRAPSRSDKCTFYITQRNGLQGAVALYAANQTRNNQGGPLLFMTLQVYLYRLESLDLDWAPV